MKILKSLALGGFAMAILAATPAAAQNGYYNQDRHDGGRNIVIGAAVGALAGAAIASGGDRHRSYGAQPGYYGYQGGYYDNRRTYGNGGYYGRPYGNPGYYGGGPRYSDRNHYRQDRRDAREHRREARRHDRRW